MKEINLAAILISKRREKGITQDELAAHIGVSKQSVSKWENRNSYPDILLLPQLASYFNISLDELMGYEPQMTADDIKKLCTELSGEFAIKPFDDVVSRCRDIVKKYFSCFPLLFQVGLLVLENSSELNDVMKRFSGIKEAKGLFTRVKTLCDDMEIKHLALLSEAVCELELENPNAVISLLENIRSRFSFHPSVEAMLAHSYCMLEKNKDAKITLQGAIFESIAAFLHNTTHYLSIAIDDKEHFDEICSRTTQMIEIFNGKEVYPLAIMPFYLEAAKGYLAIGNTEKALTMLETYGGIVIGDISSTAPKRDNFFTLLDEHQSKAKNGNLFGVSDELTGWSLQNAINVIVNEPEFAALIDEPRYKALTKKLEAHT